MNSSQKNRLDELLFMSQKNFEYKESIGGKIIRYSRNIINVYSFILHE